MMGGLLRKFIKDVAWVWISILKIYFSVVWATFRMFYPEEERPVNNDIVLITGSGKGVGRELARQYGLLGAQIICVDMDSNSNKRTMEILKELDIRAFEYICDISDRNTVFALAAEIRKNVGFVTILINNTEIIIRKKYEELDPEEKERTIFVNVLAQFWMVQAFLPTMIANDYGHIVAISSIAGLNGYPYVAPYCASKFSVRGLMEGLCTEMRAEKHNIKTTIVYPFIADNGCNGNPPTGYAGLLGKQRPEEVARSIISAQRRGHKEVSIPFFLQFVHNLESLLPDKTRNLIK